MQFARHCATHTFVTSKRTQAEARVPEVAFPLITAHIPYYHLIRAAVYCTEYLSREAIDLRDCWPSVCPPTLQAMNSFDDFIEKTLKWRRKFKKESFAKVYTRMALVGKTGRKELEEAVRQLVDNCRWAYRAHKIGASELTKLKKSIAKGMENLFALSLLLFTETIFGCDLQKLYFAFLANVERLPQN